MTRPTRSSRTWPTASAALVTTPVASLLTPAFVRVLLLQFVFGAAFSVYFLLPKFLATELSANAATMGAATAVSLIAAVVASPTLGRLLDRHGRRPLFLGGAAVTLVGSCGMASVTEVGPWLYALRAVQGIGFAGLFNAAAASVADLTPAGRLGQAMGLLGVASLFTNAAAPALAEAVAHAWGWKPVFYGSALMSALALALALSFEETARRETFVAAPGMKADEISLLAVSIMTGAAFGTLMTFTQAYALEQGALRVSGFFIGFTLAAMLVRLAFGNMADRIGRRRVAQYALAAYGLVTLATAGLRPQWLELCGFGFGLGHGFLYPSLAALVVERTDAARRGRALSSFNAAFNAGCGISMVGCGLLARAAGYSPVFLLVGVLTLASLPLLRARGSRLHPADS